MPPLPQQAAVLQELAVIETLPIIELDHGLRAEPKHPDGFPVEILHLPTPSPSSFSNASTNPSFQPFQVRCGHGPWTLGFSNEDEALDLFFACLTVDTRLTVIRRGTTEVAWTIELLQSHGQWQPLHTVRRFFQPFWFPATTVHLSNPFLRSPDSPSAKTL